MTHKNILEIWDSYTDPKNRLSLEITVDNNLIVLESISRNEIARFTPKMKIKVLKQLIEVLGFVEKHEIHST